MDAYGYLNTRLGGHQAYASKVIDILEEKYIIINKTEMEENKVLSIEVVRGIKEQLEAEIFTMISVVEERTGCRIDSIDIQRSFIQAGEQEMALDTKVKVTMRI